MKFYILGNGFDRAHGIPTSYADFKQYLKDHDHGDPTMQDQLEKMFVFDGDWKNFEEALAFPNKEAEQVYEKLELVDVFSKVLTEWFQEWFNTIDAKIVPQCKKEFKGFTNEDYYLSFNYTSLLTLSEYDIDTSHVCKIHNSVAMRYYFRDEKDMQLVFGHGNKIIVDEGKSKLATLLYKDTEKAYARNKDFFERVEYQPIEEIIVIGFSYSLIDQYYFDRIRKMFPTTRWVLGTHSKEDIKNCKKFINAVGIKNYIIVDSDTLK